MPISRERQGEASILLMALIWGIFPVIAAISIKSVSPLVSLGISTFFAALFFAGVLTYKNKWADVTNKKAFWDIIWCSLIIGAGYYPLYYFGLRYTSAGNVAIIALTEVFFAFLLFHGWHKHYIPKVHIFGIALLVLAAVIVLLPNYRELRYGDFFILTGAFFIPLGNFFAQRARKSVGSEAILFIRSAISFPIIFFCFCPGFGFFHARN